MTRERERDRKKDKIVLNTIQIKYHSNKRKIEREREKKINSLCSSQIDTFNKEINITMTSSSCLFSLKSINRLPPVTHIVNVLVKATLFAVF